MNCLQAIVPENEIRLPGSEVRHKTMSEAILQSSTHQRLEPFLILSKSVKGVANIKLIQDVLAAPGVYVFAELLESPNMMEVSVPA